MTRLIDADALKLLICSNVYPVVDYFNSKDYGMFWTGGIEKAIDEQPTVDAVPIEYIQKEIEELEESLDFYGSIGEYDALRIDAMYQHDALTGLLRHWKAERKEK